MDTQTPQVIDGEVVEQEAKFATEGQAEVIVNLGELIKNHIASLDKLRDEVKKLKEMHEDGFINDAVYRQHAEQAKEATKVKQETKQQIAKQPAIAQLSAKIRSISAEIKERKMALSEYLLEYQRLTGVNEIETKEGEIREIVNEARVVRKSARAR